MTHSCTLLSLATALLLASATAAAQSPPAAAVDPAVLPTALEPAVLEPAAPQPPTVAGQPQAANADDRLADRVADRNCLRHTGSLIRESRRAADRAGKRCIPAFGRAYSQDDLRDTGAVDLADALRRLDPAIH